MHVEDTDLLRLTVGLFNGPRDEMERYWKPVRVLNGGTDALRDALEEFTPRTAREIQEPQLYQARLKSSVLHDVYNETVHGVAARAFERPPTITGEPPEGLEKLATNADRNGTSLSVFGLQIYTDAINKGLGVFLVDNVPTVIADPVLNDDGEQVIGDDGRPQFVERTLTLREAEEIDARPYLSRIDPDNIIGWRTETRNAREVCTELRVREWIYRQAPGTYQDMLVERVRLYTGTTVEVWERNYGRGSLNEDRYKLAGKGDNTGFALVEGPYETGFPDGEIPIVVVYTRRIGFMHAKPPFLQLAHLNLKHWNQQSVLDSSVRFSMHPVLMLTGLTQEEAEQRPRLGEGATFASASDSATGTYVEIGGTSLAVAQKEIEKTELRMRSRAADPLMAGSATATGEVRAEMKDQSEAQSWIEAMEWGLYRAYELAAKWIGQTLPEDFNVTLHRASSILQVANPQRTANLQADAREGRITNLTYLKERARSGDFADDFDPDVEAEAVEQDAERKVIRQMEAMAAGMISQRGAGDAAVESNNNEDPEGEEEAKQDEETPPPFGGSDDE